MIQAVSDTFNRTRICLIIWNLHKLKLVKEKIYIMVEIYNHFEAFQKKETMYIPSLVLFSLSKRERDRRRKTAHTWAHILVGYSQIYRRNFAWNWPVLTYFSITFDQTSQWNMRFLARHYGLWCSLKKLSVVILSIIMDSLF